MVATPNISRREGAEDQLLQEQLKVDSKDEQMLAEELELVKLDRPWVKRPICIITTVVAAQPVQLCLGGVPADPPEVHQVAALSCLGGQAQLVDVAVLCPQIKSHLCLYSAAHVYCAIRCFLGAAATRIL